MSAGVSRATVTFLIKLLAISAFLGTSCAVESTGSLTVSETKSASSDSLTSSRHKRAPGWGKRAPGWGKRAPGWGKRNDVSNEFFDLPESVLDSLNRVHTLKSNSYLPVEVSFSEKSKRAPGWGKRSWDNDVYQSALTRDRGNANTHWRKRRSDAEQGDESIETERRAPGWGKRAPGWGKRSYEDDFNFNNADLNVGSDIWDDNVDVDQQLFENSEISHEPTNIMLPARTLFSRDLLSMERREPVWAGKRAPGWGKRDYQIVIPDEDASAEKRAPGWGKRAPGWGKRAPGWGKRDDQTGSDDDATEKRAPGWGKRVATRVKRSPNSISTSTKDTCNHLQVLERAHIARVQEVRTRIMSVSLSLTTMYDVQLRVKHTQNDVFV